MSRKSLIPLACVLALLAAPALAEEIVHFTNGTTMAIESHSIEEGRVLVSLGEQAFLEFPLEQIDKIETAEGEVALPKPGKNRMVPRPTAEAGIVRGSVPSRHRRGQWQAEAEPQDRDDVDVDRNGVAVYRPYGRNAPSNKRQIGLTGRRELRTAAPSGSGGSGVAGATRLGARHVLPPDETGDTKPEPIGLTAKGGSSPPKKKKKN